jgi:hypothetical protein
MSDLKLPFGSNKCKCDACGEYFFSSGAFDRHRTGSYTQRRCWTYEEMVADGMTITASGYWTHGDSAGLRQRIGASGVHRQDAVT